MSSRQPSAVYPLVHRPRPHPRERERLANSLRLPRQESRPELLYAHLLDWLYSFDSLVLLGRRRVLSEAFSDPPARNPGSPLKGGPSARHAL
jgi:hypothetical protein